MKRFILSGMLLAAMAANAQVQTVVTFEDAALAEDGTLQGVSYTESGYKFDNYYTNEGFTYNSGYTVSNKTDRNTAGPSNQYSADARGGVNGSKNFAIYNSCYYGPCYIHRADGNDFTPIQVSLALTTYTSLCIQDGDSYTKKFTDGDYFAMILTGLDAEDNEVSTTYVPLVDYPYMWTPWAVADLSELGTVNKILVSFESSDMGSFGMNTPAYIALDNFTAEADEVTASDVATFEDLTLEPESFWAGDDQGELVMYDMAYKGTFTSGAYSFDNYYVEDYDTWFGYAYSNQTSTEYNGIEDQYRSCVGSGVDGSATYMVAYPDYSMWGPDYCPLISVIGEPRIVPGFYITNAAYTLTSMLKGDAYIGDPFTVGDYYKITIHALDADGKETATRDFCLADYRFENEADRYAVKDWTYVDLSQLGETAAFSFSFDGTRKSGKWMSIPTYFCVDNFGAEGTEDVRAEGTYEGPSAGVSILTADDKEPVIYNMQGIRVNEMTTPGIYSINGRKYLKR